MKILIGADPEVFMGTPKGTPVSAHNAIPGTKENPHRVVDGAVQVDGMALEFNINPVEEEGEFVHHINSVMQQLESMVPANTLLIKPSVIFRRSIMDKQPDEAKELGCSPDFNAYHNGVANQPPNADTLLRTAAGHVHIGWGEGFDIKSKQHIKDCCALVQELDVVLGVPSILLDTDNQRRLLYGKAGAFRPKSYGVEYRVLSNFWLKSDALKRWVYRGVKIAVGNLQRGCPLHTKGYSTRVTINSAKKMAAKRICEREGINYHV